MHWLQDCHYKWKKQKHNKPTVYNVHVFNTLFKDSALFRFTAIGTQPRISFAFLYIFKCYFVVSTYLFSVFLCFVEPNEEHENLNRKRRSNICQLCEYICTGV